ncbi:putative ima1 N-terminal domain [Lyophyllum shimeji]|uniref:Ima1 N-terminal domain n=1 Tax=Lyophyllum shimeji TaxID=47721 RepID=A0A9P3ULT8_LYOSH|nr:putative ima1 N-terminal domain [Lyophyllum shimeji]
MHVESLNAKSFAMRASTSQNQLPTMYGKGPFCHTCQSNQLLIINLLSNYLPPANDPEYAARLEMLPEYRESLHVRYPPVCDECLPAVEDEIRRKDHMARTKALGGWLNDSKGKERQRRVSEGYREPEKVTAEVIIWRIRGVLWAASFAISIVRNLAGALGVRFFRPLTVFQPILPGVVLLSLLWTVWDPTYASLQRAQRQGRDVRVRGKSRYIKMQMTAWFSRLVTSSLLALAWHRPDWDHSISSPSSSRTYFAFSLFVELAALTVSCMVLRLHQPPAVRLLDTSSHKLSLSRSATPHTSTREGTPAVGLGRPSTTANPDPLAALSLSSKPVMTPSNPVFGLPSLLSAVPSSSAPEEVDVDAMDWTPTEGSGSGKSMTKQESDADSWLRPQRFFAPAKPTGLEGLFERTLLVADDPPVVIDEGKTRKTEFLGWRYLRRWWWAYLLFVVPLGGVVYKVQDSRRNMPRPLYGPETSLM